MTTKIYGDYHIHTNWSDGKDTIEAVVAAAKQQGLRTIALTEHGVTNPSYSVKKARAQRQAMDSLSPTWDIEVLLGNEHDIVGLDGALDGVEEWSLFDIHLAGFHQFSRPKTLKDAWLWYLPNMLGLHTPKVVERNTKAVIACVQRYPVDVLTHLNHRVKVDVAAVAQACAKAGTMIELNIKHLDVLLPALGAIKDSGVRLILNTDAHRANQVGVVDAAWAIVQQYDLLPMVVNASEAPIVWRSQQQG